MKTKAISFALASLLTTASMSRAFAQSPPSALAPPAASPPAVATAKPAPVPAPARDTDPNIDRGFLQPTAMTQPAGSLTYNNYELLLHGLTYGITDNLQASVTVLSPIVDSMPFLGFGAVKWHVSPAPRLHVALQGSLGFGHEFGSGSGSLYTLGAGGFASVCLRDDCSSLLSASGTYQLAMAGGQDGRAHVVIYGGSLVHGVTPRFKLLAEITSAAGRAVSPDESSSGFDNMPGILASYGVRFHSGNVAADVGFVKPILDEGTGGILLGLPFVNVSYRWM